MNSSPPVFPNSLNELVSQLLSNGNQVHPIIQFFKYAFVGGLSTLVHIITFYIVGYKLFPCIEEKDIVSKILKIKHSLIDETKRARNAVISNIIAFFVSNTFCYILNRLFVFQPGKHHIFVEFVMFFSVSAFAIFLGSFIMKLLISKFKLQTTIAFTANLFTSLAFNYILRKLIIFNG